MGSKIKALNKFLKNKKNNGCMFEETKACFEIMTIKFANKI